MPATLTGVSVVVTRPQEQAEPWVSALTDCGAEVLTIPTLAIEILPIEHPQRGYVLDLDRYDTVICVSPNAVKIGLAGLADYWPQWPVQQQWIAVGPATGAEMQRWGLPQLKVAQQGDTSESLLDWPELQASRVVGKRVLIMRGAGGREALANELRQRGAEVDYIEWYRRSVPQVDIAPLINHIVAGDSIILTVTSGDGLRNLITLVGDLHKAALMRLPLVVVSGRLAEFARQLGFTDVWQAVSPAIDDVIITLEQVNAQRTANDRDN